MGGNTVYLENQTVGMGGGAGRAGHRGQWEKPRQFYGDRYEQEEGWEPEQPRRGFDPLQNVWVNQELDVLCLR